MAKCRKKMKIPGVSFSAKRAFGITKAKRSFSRKTGIPLSKASMQRKVGKAVTGGGCVLPMLSLMVVSMGIALILALMDF